MKLVIADEGLNASQAGSEASRSADASQTTAVSVEDVLEQARAAGARIAPVWPLDRYIAVNPWWSAVAEPLEQVAARQAAGSGASLVMARSWFAGCWKDGAIARHHLEAALADKCGQADGSASWTVDGLIALLEREPRLHRVGLMTHVLDAERRGGRQMLWETEVTHEISQFCASRFDRGQAAWTPSGPQALYEAWREQVAHNHGIGLLMAAPDLVQILRGLPDSPEAVLAVTVEELGVDAHHRVDFLHTLLLSINGWASWCAWQGWQAGLAGDTDGDRALLELTAVRAAWELALWRLAEGGDARARWRREQAAWSAAIAHNRAELAGDWIWQRAAELAWQEKLIGSIRLGDGAAASAGDSSPRPEVQPEVQAVFCIDVRSEVLRRALEQVTPLVHTRGFAGFFGLPLEFQPLGTDLHRPQLPGLLAPRLEVTEASSHGEEDTTAIAGKRRQRLVRTDLWRRMRTAATGGFGYVESAGLFYAAKLAREALFGEHAAEAGPGLSPEEAARLIPVLADAPGASPEQRLASRVELAAGVLGAMSLRTGFAPLVALVGHGSASANNPHAAGLDCGACCGGTGEVNARVLASLLNDPDVRAGLTKHNISIPSATRFVAGLHNTTTDEVTLFEDGPVEGAQAVRLAELGEWFDQAGALARAERAPALGLGAGDDAHLLARMQERAADWAQVRPEWGLAGNAAFVVGPRWRTQGADLGGRVFLHDYDWRADTDGRVLELILTAPMVVTHWINMQYYASTVDPVRYGAGNKVLHNVVGGGVGVFDGNGGDLRTGLALQSVHDGRRWMHEPLRLTVVVDAPRAAIERVVANHETVRQLVDNQWLYLVSLDEQSPVPQRLLGGRWLDFVPGADRSPL
jgi:uncharacterized protein YbcC (UPF0753/DUF2309 family)